MRMNAMEHVERNRDVYVAMAKRCYSMSRDPLTYRTRFCSFSVSRLVLEIVEAIDNVGELFTVEDGKETKIELQPLIKEAYEKEFEPFPAAPFPLALEDAARRAKALLGLIGKAGRKEQSDMEGLRVLNPSYGIIEVFCYVDAETINYCWFHGRFVDPPDAETLKELVRMRNKKWNRNRGGHREHFVLEISHVLDQVGHMVEAPDHGVFQGRSRYHLDNLGEFVKSEIPEGVSKREYDIRFASAMGWYTGVLHSLSLTDTPIWISMKPDLCKLLTITDLKGVLAEDVRMVHPVLLIEVPSEMITMDRETGRSEVKMIMVYMMREQNSSRTFLMMHPLLAYVDRPDPKYAGALALLEIPTDPSEQVDLAARPEDALSDAATLYFVYGEPLKGHEFFSVLRTFVLNTILYLDSPGAEIQKREPDPVHLKRKREAKKKVVNVTYKEWVVGSSITIDKGAEIRYGSGALPKTYTIHTHSYYVKGFWMMQAHGPGRTLRKKQWRPPQVRRRDLSKVLGKTYVET